jgi:hypothetical protein
MSLTYIVDKEIRQLTDLSRQLRIFGLSSLILTVANVVTLASLFLVYFLDQKIFKGGQAALGNTVTSYEVRQLQQIIIFILAVGFIIFLSVLYALYRFDLIKKEVLATVGEIFDQVAWGAKGSNVERHIDVNLGLEQRIAIRKASESANLPFLGESQGAGIYVLFNIFLITAVGVIDLYLVQLLPSLSY